MTTDADHPEVKPSVVPDASPGDGDDLSCPMCGYSLRGLIDPRCPECGYAFDWTQLREARRAGHPFLFEHHPRRNLWSLRRTLTAGLRPRRFWGSVSAAHVVNVRRLALYHVLTTGLVMVTVIATGMVATGIREYVGNRDGRRMTTPWLASLPPTTAAQVLGGSTVQQYLDFAYPMPPTRAFFRNVLRRQLDQQHTLTVPVLILSWPWLTWLALQVFIWSMHRAKVLPRHITRCVVYSTDAFAWLAPFQIAAAVAPLLLAPGIGRGISAGAELSLLAIVPVWLLACYRLTVAYQTYLHFPRAAAVVVASQVMALLTMLILL